MTIESGWTEREIAVLDWSMLKLLSVKTGKLATHAKKALRFRWTRRQRLQTGGGFAVTAIFQQRKEAVISPVLLEPLFNRRTKGHFNLILVRVGVSKNRGAKFAQNQDAFESRPADLFPIHFRGADASMPIALNVMKSLRGPVEDPSYAF